MNSYYIKFLLCRDGRWYRVPVVVGLALLPVLELALFGWQLQEAHRRLYVYPRGQLSGELALPLSQLVDQSGALYLFNGLVLLMLGLMIPVFLSDTRDGRNICTQMRLPFSRLYYYGVRLLLPTGALVLFWLEQLLLLFACRGLYLWVIPAPCLPERVEFWQSALCLAWYPAAEPQLFPAAACVLALLPAAVALWAFWIRGRDLLCALAALLGTAALALFFAGRTLAAGLPLATVAVICCGGYAVCRRNTF